MQLCYAQEILNYDSNGEEITHKIDTNNDRHSYDKFFAMDQEGVGVGGTKTPDICAHT